MKGRALPIAALLLALPWQAAAQAASVDQVLAALAEVVRDRAKAVASRTIARQLTKQLCHGTLVLPPRSGAGAARALPAVRGWDGSLTLHLGGTDDCRTKGACTADDVFLRTCRLVDRLDVPLTDAYLLKSLSRDTVDLVMRIAGRDLREPDFRDSGLVELGAFVHAAMEQAVRDRPRPGELAGPVLALADRLSTGLPDRTFADLDRAATRTFEEALRTAVVEPWVKERCAPHPSTGTPAPPACEVAWFAADCETYETHRAERRALFDALFGKKAGLLRDGRDRSCDAAFGKDAASPDAAKRTQCHRARVAHNLYGYLVRGRCAASLDATRRRSLFRELGYVAAEQAVHREALTELAPGLLPQLDGFLDRVQALDLGELPREELASGVRALGLYLRAADAAPEETTRWLGTLRRDLQRAAEARDPYWELLHAEALGTDTRHDSVPVADLAGAVKHLLAMPGLALATRPGRLDSAAEARRRLATAAETTRAAVTRLVQTLAEDPGAGGSRAALLKALPDLLGDLAKAADALADALDDAPVADHFRAVKVDLAMAKARETAEATAKVAGLSAEKARAEELEATETAARSVARLQDRRPVFLRAAAALDRGARVLSFAADRDWLGFVVTLADELSAPPAPAGNVPEVQRSLRFVRVLLSMYQAGSVAEAKAIFESNLEDVASRERRFGTGTWTLDVGAVVGFTAGHHEAWVHADGGEAQRRGETYGLAAPFGVQLANRHAGLLFYPLDLGSYLTTKAPDEGRDWREALRVGGLVLVRFSAEIPLVLGLGGDYQFERGGRRELRALAQLGLELPLYTLR